MKEATFISFSAAPRVQRALSSPKQQHQSTNSIWWMNTSQGGMILGSKSHLNRNLILAGACKRLHVCVRIMIVCVFFRTKNS